MYASRKVKILKERKCEPRNLVENEFQKTKMPTHMNGW